MSTATPSPPTLSQVVALTYTYQRIVVVWGAFPVLTMLLPFVMGSSLFVLNHLTGGHGMISLGLTVFFTLGGYRMIHRLAISKESLQSSLDKNEVRLPVVMFIVSCILARFIFGPLVTWFGLMPWIPTKMITFSGAFRFAFGMALLGLAVVARYIGPASISEYKKVESLLIDLIGAFSRQLLFVLYSSVRCSSVPLVSNPLETTFQHLIRHPLSILEPSDTPGELLTSSLHRYTKGRRFQHSSFRSTGAQVILSVMMGIIVAFSTVFHWFDRPHSDDFGRATILATCVLTLLSPLVMTGLNGHELDPNDYLRPSGALLPIGGRQVLQKAFIAATLVPAISVFAGFLVSTDDPVDFWDLFLQLSVYCFLMSLYLQAIDEAIRTAFFSPKADLKRLVDELQDDSSLATMLDVILHSLLQDGGLVKDVWSPTQKPGVVDLDSQELRRTGDLMKQMGTVALSKATGYLEAPFEEDVMRVIILESFGGTQEGGMHTGGSNTQIVPRGNGSQTTHALKGGPDTRHEDVIKSWVDWKFTKTGNRREPLSLPLVRGFCVFAGGIGEALLACSSQKTLKTTQSRLSKPQSMVESWTLPQGAIVCASFAVTAVTRCIARSLKAPERPVADWKSAQLSTLVPSALNAFFRLRTGILAYSNYRGLDMSREVNVGAGALSPELLRLLRVCDDSASEILKSLKSPQGRGRLDLPLDKECLAWTKQLLP
jgi:hypothetical protein